MTLEGYKMCNVIDRLNELGFKNSGGKEFNAANIEKILRNERYTGVYLFTYNKGKFVNYEEQATIRVDDGLPQIISKETFDAIQQILKQRVHRTPKNVEEKYLLSNKIFCGECGTPYSGIRKITDKKYYVFYRCGYHFTYRNGKRVVDHCRNTAVRRDDIEKYVVKQISKIIYNEDLIDTIMDEYGRYTKCTHCVQI